MTALIIVGAVLLALVLLSLLKCGVEVAYDESGFWWRLRVGFLRFSLPRKKETAPSPAHKAGGKTKAPKAKTKQQTKPKPSLAYLQALAALGFRLLKRFFRHLHIDRLRIYFLSAYDDLYDTAMAYGWAGTAMEALTAFADGRIRRLELHTELDFDSTQPQLEAQIVIYARLGALVALAVSALHGYRAIRRENKISEKEKKHGKSVDR